MVDLAYMLDPELPLELASIYDDDPAKEEYRERVRLQVEEQELKRKIGNPNGDIDYSTIRNDDDLASATWEALGALHAGRMIPIDMGRSRNMIACASRYPLDTSYPMYSWAFANVMLKYANTPSGKIYIRNMFEGVLSGVDFFFRVSGTDSTFRSNLEWQDFGEEGRHIVVGAGEREKGIRFLREWLKENGEEYITVVDPYFGTDDLILLGLIMEIDPNLRVRILAGENGQNETSGSLQNAYSSAWRQLYEHSPPDTEVTIVTLVDSGRTPFHDRWILSKSVGLRMGISFNGLGNRDSEISELSGEEHGRIGRYVAQYLGRDKRVVDGEKIAYQLFDLVV